MSVSESSVAPRTASDTDVDHGSIRDVVVRSRTTAAEGVVVLQLESPSGDLLPVWQPGAHIDLHASTGMIRQYSLCGDPEDLSAWHVGILRDPNSRGGSAWVHDAVSEGDVLRVGNPRNHFRLEPSHRYLFIAGGIGITPIKAMISQAVRDGADWKLIYGGRTRASMAFLDELAEHGDRASINPQDESGRLKLAEALADPREDTLVYCCGPEPLLAAVESECASWPPGALHIERFTAAAASPAEGEDRSIRVTMERLGKTIDVAHDQSILEAVTDAGADVLSSCEDGICGTCMTTVLRGTPEHRDSVLSKRERDAGNCMMVCVSRARSDELVLDL